MHWIACLLALLLLYPPVTSFAMTPPTRPAWAGTARLSTLSHGHWTPATTVDSLGELRGDFTVRGRDLHGQSMRATMALMHFSWQGFKPVTMAPAILVPMQRQRVSPGSVTFSVTVRIPTILPVEWSIVRFAATNGRTHIETHAGIMVGKPVERVPSNTLTIAQARTFCAARSRLPYLDYAVYLHGYFVGLPTGDDGPGSGIILDQPRHVTAAVLRLATYRHGIRTGGFTLPRTDTWMTRSGFLGCTNGEPHGFVMDV